MIRPPLRAAMRVTSSTNLRISVSTEDSARTAYTRSVSRAHHSARRIPASRSSRPIGRSSSAVPAVRTRCRIRANRPGRASSFARAAARAPSASNWRNPQPFTNTLSRAFAVGARFTTTGHRSPSASSAPFSANSASRDRWAASRVTPEIASSLQVFGDRGGMANTIRAAMPDSNRSWDASRLRTPGWIPPVMLVAACGTNTWVLSPVLRS